MANDIVSEIQIEGLRTIEKLRLPLRGLTVLIGENGSGKSSILEACELLRRVSGPMFLSEVSGIHGGLFSLLRHGATQLTLGARIEDKAGAEPPLTYRITVARLGRGYEISEESLALDPSPGTSEPTQLLQRRRGEKPWITPKNAGLLSLAGLDPARSLLCTFGGLPEQAGIMRAREALERIRVHVPFEVLPAWVARAHDRKSVPRGEILLAPASRLDRLADNLANVYAALRTDFGERHWDETMDYVRLGLGDRVETINTRAGPGGGATALWMKLANKDEQLPAASLADGVLAYLAFVALFRFPEERSLLCFDEPELHMHPRLLMRVLGFFERMATEAPVILATHSDLLLDALKVPENSIVLCELSGEQSATVLKRPDKDALSQWLVDYRGAGDLRREGFLNQVMRDLGADT